jgi:hypothetical protein
VDGILEMKGHEEGELTVEEEEIRVLVEQKAEYLWEALLVELEYKRSKEEREERRRVVSMAKLKNSEGRGRDKVVRIVNKDEMDEEWWIGLQEKQRRTRREKKSRIDGKVEEQWRQRSW